MTKKEKEFIREMTEKRDMPFLRIGMQVECNGDIGTIVGKSESVNLKVVFANQLKYGKKYRVCHPKWRIRYFDKDGKVIACYYDYP